MRKFTFLLRAIVFVLLVGVSHVEGLGRVCELQNLSESLGEFEQSWRIHCIGRAIARPIPLWSLQGRLLCPGFPFVNPRKGVTGKQEVLEVDFIGTCFWLLPFYLKEPPPPAFAECDCCQGYWPCDKERESRYSPMITDPFKSYSIVHDTQLQLTIKAVDDDGDLIGFDWKDPKHGEVMGPGPALDVPAREKTLTLTYQPNECWTGTDGFEYYAYDSAFHVGHGYVTIKVENHSPKVVSGNLSASLTVYLRPEGIGGKKAVLLGSVSITDPDGDALTTRLQSQPHYGFVNPTIGGSSLYGTYQFFASKDDLIRPCCNHDDLVDHFSVAVSDGHSGEVSIPGTVTIHVVDATLPDVVTKNITVDLNENGQASITPQEIDNGSTDNCGIATMILDKDTFTCADLGANTVTLTVTDTSSNSASGQATITVVDNIPPILTVPPNVTIECGESTDPSHTGQASAADNCDPNPQITHSDSTSESCPTLITRTWTATDACGNSTTGTQQITVQDTTSPELHCPGDVTADTHDPSGTTVTFTVTATDACDPNPTVMCTPASGNHFPVGTTTVTCEATDACGNTSSPCNFTVTVTFVNHPPNAVNDPATTPEDTAVTIAVLANDSDPDGDLLNVTSVTNPPHGTAMIVGSQLRYTPDFGFSGTDSFTYTITDPYGATDSAQVTVSVEHINHPPVAYDDEYFVPNWSQPVPIHLKADDPDGDPLTYYIVSGPDHGFLTGTAPDLTYHHTGGGIPVDWFTFRVFDGYDYSNVATIVIDPPTGTP